MEHSLDYIDKYFPFWCGGNKARTESNLFNIPVVNAWTVLAVHRNAGVFLFVCFSVVGSISQATSYQVSSEINDQLNDLVIL